MMMEESDAKRRKVEEGQTPAKDEDVAMKEEPAEAPKEQEVDQKPDKRAQLGQEVQFESRDATLNVIPTVGGRVLMPLTDGGLQYLIAGARANVGVSKGRYLFEVKIVEALNPTEPPTPHGGASTPTPMPRQLVRIGFSTKDSSLFLGETQDSLCFDSEGFFTADKKRSATSQRFSRDQIIGVMVNLDRKSPNADTVSLFRDGVRVSQPQPIPEFLQGKALFPHVNFKNVTLQVNFGSTPLAPLPFTCKTVQEVAKDDGVAIPPMKKGAPYEVVFPVGLPDEGTFDWLDGFLEKNPQYTELSDRQILRWAERSGLWRPKTSSWKNSNDKPDMNFGIRMMDDFSIRRVLSAVIATQPRNYVVMEVKSNLITEERQELLRRFSAPHYKKVAMVVMGEPSSGFKDRVHEAVIKDKQETMEVEWRQRKIEKERKRTLAMQQKQLEEAKKKAEEEAKKKAEEGKPAGEVDPAVKKEEEDAAKKETEVKKEDKMDVDKDVKTEVKEEDEKKADESDDEPAPVAALTKEEKETWFRKKQVTDLTMWVLSTNFPKFTIPEKEEGFDDIRYEWKNAAGSSDYLKSYVLKNKVLCRIEDLQPSEWFRTKWADWQKVLQDWHTKQSDFKDPVKMAEKKVAELAAKKAAAEKEKKDGEEGEDKAEEKKEDEKPDDIFAVADVCNMGNGEPMFANFAFEDWALLSLRLELHLLVHAFKKDVGDPERIGIHESHLPFYYNKYYRKSFNVKYYGVEHNVALVDMVKDTVTVNRGNMVLESQLAEEMENFDMFVKLTEDQRRERQRRIDAGDETVKLKFSKPEALPQKGVPQAPRPPFPGAVGTVAVGGQPAKGGTKGYFPPTKGAAPQPGAPAGSWYAGSTAPAGKATYSTTTKGTGYTPPAPLPATGKGYAGAPQTYGGGKSYGSQRYGKGYSK